MFNYFSNILFYSSSCTTLLLFSQYHGIISPSAGSFIYFLKILSIRNENIICIIPGKNTTKIGYFADMNITKTNTINMNKELNVCLIAIKILVFTVSQHPYSNLENTGNKKIDKKPNIKITHKASTLYTEYITVDLSICETALKFSITRTANTM